MPKEVDLITIRSLEHRGFEQKSRWHWRKTLAVSAIDFWPTSGKLRWLGKTWVGGLEAVDKILSTGGRRMPDDLKAPEPKSTDSEDEGVWITIGDSCPWNPTPGIRHLFHFKDEAEANAARMVGFVGVPEAIQNPDDNSWLNFPED